MTKPSATISCRDTAGQFIVAIDSTARLYDSGVDTGNRDGSLHFSRDRSVTNWGGAGLTDVGEEICGLLAALFDEVTCHDGFQLIGTIPSGGMSVNDIADFLDTVIGVCNLHLDVTSESPVLARA